MGLSPPPFAQPRGQALRDQGTVRADPVPPVSGKRLVGPTTGGSTKSGWVGRNPSLRGSPGRRVYACQPCEGIQTAKQV